MVGAWKVGAWHLKLLLVRVEPGGGVHLVRGLLLVPAGALHPRPLHCHHQVPGYLDHLTTWITTLQCSYTFTSHLPHQRGFSRPLVKAWAHSHRTAPPVELSSVAAVAADVRAPLRPRPYQPIRSGGPPPRPRRDTGHDKAPAPLGEVGDTAPAPSCLFTNTPVPHSSATTQLTWNPA